MALLAASIWYAVGQQDEAFWLSLTEVDPGLLMALLGLIFLATIGIPALQFWIVTRPFVTTEPLSLMTMQGLCAGSALLNYTPVKAGLIGRVAYLRYFHGVGLRAALITHAMIVVIFLAACAIAFAVTFVRPQFDLLWALGILVGILVTVVVSAPLVGLLVPVSVEMDPGLRDSGSRQRRFLAACFAVQILGLFVNAVRWWVVFAIFGRPASAMDAWVAAVVHIVTVMGGPANGLGLREWLIGLAAERGLFSPQLQIDLASGVTAALVDRAAESLVIVTCGLFGLAVLRRGLKAQKELDGDPAVASEAGR